MSKKVVVGLDFDGVVAYNPIRVFRAPVSFVKRKVLGVKKTTFFVPKKTWQQQVWMFIHRTSYFPAKGVGLLKEMAGDTKYEFHLVTARYSFLKDDLYVWLAKQGLDKLFTSISVNEQDLQPHEYKAKVVGSKKFDFFVEDNLDIVLHLKKTTTTEVLWIYNLLDRTKNFKLKFAHLKAALSYIRKQ